VCVCVYHKPTGITVTINPCSNHIHRQAALIIAGAFTIILISYLSDRS